MYKCFLCDYEGDMKIKSSVEGNNKKNIEIIAKKTGFEIIYFKPALKTMTLKYMRDQFNVYKLFPITQIFNIVNCIPIVNKLKFKIRLGESLIILKKV